jgi:uncharacterized damage-inducible protein DinB
MTIPDLRRLFAHAQWADQVLFEALQGAPGAPAEAWREFAHAVGAGEIWLARLEGRPPHAAVWPELPPAELDALAARVHAGYSTYLARLSEETTGDSVSYTNTAGRSFETAVGDILCHVALHGQYHRGKINLLLRQAGMKPAPTDFIAFVRGAPAATTADARKQPGAR